LNTIAPLSALGFDAVVEIKESFSTVEKIFWNTINWLNTNRKGMTFSFVFGSFFLALMPCLNLKQSLSGFKSALLGLGIGAPLGVCVNCAAPIARAMQASGYALQTSLAALIASPSLNIVVIMMAFSMFPFHMVATRLVFVFIFILVLIPLACHFLFGREVEVQKSGEKFCKTTMPDKDKDIVFAAGLRGWWQAALWALKAYVIAFLTLLKIALPLMILAGFLGSVAITLLPWDVFHNLDMHLSAGMIVGVMFLLSIFGTLLPSPIAFDVVLSSVLLQVGVPLPYVAVFFFTLGTFSIYALFIVWQAVSFRVAGFLFMTTAVLGILAGGIAMVAEEQLLAKADNELKQVILAKTEEKKLTKISEQVNEFDPVVKRPSDDIVDFSALSEIIAKQRFELAQISKDKLTSVPEGIQILQHDLMQRQANTRDKFTRVYGEEIGIQQPYLVSYTSFVPDDQVFSTMSVASGDVHNDGWPDLLLMGDQEVQPNLVLYSNIGGTEFKRQDLPVTVDMGLVVSVSMADLNADGWLDIVFSTYEGGNYAIYNDQGNFLPDNVKMLREKGGYTTSFGYADFDRDGDVDIFEGNWGYGPLSINRGKSQNYVLYANEDGYEAKPLEGLTGETLAAIIADINGDGNIDIYVGNDFVMHERSDQLYLGDGKGGFEIFGDRAEEIGVYGAHSSMSAEYADIDNDLVPELYIGQIAYGGQYMHAMTKIAERQIAFATFCAVQGIPGKSDEECLENMKFRESLVKVSHYITDACSGLKNTIHKQKCMAHMLHYKKECLSFLGIGLPEDEENTKEELKKILSDRYLEICARDEDDEFEGEYTMDENIMASNASLYNVLLRTDREGGHYTEESNKRGIGYGGWTWNSRFADIDLDGWKDLYIVNGHNLPITLASNVFYLNKGDGYFDDKTKEYKLEDYSMTTAYAYMDYDRDGDLDIVTVPMDMPVTIYRNETQENNAVTFVLDDKSAKNPFAYGAQIIVSYEVDGEIQQQRVDIQGSGGYKSFNPPEAHFGLGAAQTIKSVLIKWPDGSESTVEGDLAANKFYKIVKE